MALAMTTPVEKLGFTAEDLKALSPRVRALTKADLISLMAFPESAKSTLELTISDLRGLHNVVTTRMKKGTTTGGGGSGDGGFRCCCCIACCCCCCAVSVSASHVTI